jgi:hypothetical protein
MENVMVQPLHWGNRGVSRTFKIFSHYRGRLEQWYERKTIHEIVNWRPLQHVWLLAESFALVRRSGVDD